ncbi:uncharacterized protein LOC122320086 [Drosophila ficusphila]|uniref:uncharacterized protein LOC122320086 n=1 Tax=Drosophila ficusphila TaxID=30025 RepID=UPI001C89D904|nr:uncharacterized protein LOC122320086 [Drosophila ficusphila]
MGNLPADRLHGNRPFEVSGVDFCGPIFVTLGIRGKSAVKMFVGRRGRVQKIFCDNATNFVGASRMLQEFRDHFIANQDAITEFAATRGITFSFIPPRAPHFGGLWEAAVKSAKGLMVKAVGSAVLRQDELNTVLVEVEAILNSRPIVVDSSNPNDGEAVTPDHLLVGTTLVALPFVSSQPVTDDKLSYLKRWQLISAVKQRFWVDWQKDYALSLQQRQKWLSESHNIQIRTIVVVHEDNSPPQQWLMGVIEEAIKGEDGKVRVAVVRTKSGVFKRSIRRLAPLPVNEF